MPNKPDKLIASLTHLGLTREEALLYVELLKGPRTHLRLSHLTGINRTKVYRLAETLEKRSLVARRVDDRGAFLVATDPATLEVDLVTKEEKLKQERLTFQSILPVLMALRGKESSPFIVRTYEGEEGFKQAIWHELKAKGELCVFGSGTTEELISNHRWAEKHRELNIRAGYRVRELINQRKEDRPVDFTQHAEFMGVYSYRLIPQEVLLLDNQIVVYNDNVSVYHWRKGQKVGVEMINASLAAMMRQIFEYYWSIAKELGE